MSQSRTLHEASLVRVLHLLGDRILATVRHAAREDDGSAGPVDAALERREKAVGAKERSYVYATSSAILTHPLSL